MLGFRDTQPRGEIPYLPNPHREYGRTTAVMDGFFQKQSLLRQAQKATGDVREGLLAQANEIFCGVLFSGGGLGVATQIGFAEELYNSGFTNDGTINAYIGMSGGAIVASHSAIGDFDGVNILPEVCESGFVTGIRERRFPRIWEQLNYKALLTVLRRYKLDPKRLRQAKPDIYAVTVEIRDDEDGGIHHAFNMKEVDDPEEVLGGSSHIPVFSMQGHSVIDGIKHNDGSLLGYPIDLMDRLVPQGVKEVHWLIINALPIERKPQDYTFANTLGSIGRRLRNSTHRTGLQYLQRYNDTRAQIYMRHWPEDEESITENYGFVAPERADVTTFETNKGVVEQGITDSRPAAKEFMERHRTRWLLNTEPISQTA